MTPYDDILDLALISIEDYRLNKLSVESPAKFKLVLEGFMIRGLSNFENCVKNLSDRGCYVMLSNHNTILINELYKDFYIHKITAKRNINSNGKKRGKVEEVIITNYEIDLSFED